MSDDQPILPLSLPPSREQALLAACIAVALLIGAAATFPFAQIQLAVYPAFVVFITTTLVFAHLTTATLLFTLFLFQGTRSLLTLASGYVLTAFLLGAWGLTFPDAFAENGLFDAGLQTTFYLYAFSRFAFPLAAIAYCVLKSTDRHPPLISKRRAVLVGIVCALSVGVALVLLATAGSAVLPPVMVDAQRGNPFTGPFVAVVAVALLLFAMAFLWRRKMSVLDLWLLLTLWTWLVELIVLAMTTVRFSFNWYTGLLLELASTTFILAGLLSQTLALYARLALATAVQRRERDSRRLALNAALAALAHETYQPITAIAANSSAGLRHLGRDAPDLDEVHDIFNDIIADTRRTSDAIDAIRGIFKVDVSARTPLAVEGLVQEVLSMVKSELLAHNVTADVSFEEGLPEIAGNREQLQQVLLNLIANAIEAMDDVTTRPRRLQVWAVKEGNEVLVTLRDSGPGIDPAQAGQIFDPFMTTKPRGSGLGLPICRSIIEAHAGRMRAASAVPHGAVFGFTLPVAS